MKFKSDVKAAMQARKNQFSNQSRLGIGTELGQPIGLLGLSLRPRASGGLAGP